MDHSLTFELSDALMRAGLRRYYRRRWLGWRSLLLLVVITGLSLLLARQKNAAFWLVYLALFIAVFFGMSLFTYRWSRRRQARFYGRTAARQLTCLLGESGLTLRGTTGEFNRPWAYYPRLWRFRDVWLLIDSTNTFLPLPAEKLAGAPGEFLARKVREAGGQVA